MQKLFVNKPKPGRQGTEAEKHKDSGRNAGKIDMGTGIEHGRLTQTN